MRRYIVFILKILGYGTGTSLLALLLCNGVPWLWLLDVLVLDGVILSWENGPFSQYFTNKKEE